MGSVAEEEYAAFLEKVKRTIYVDNLSPLVSEAVIKAAFNQFGSVGSVNFIKNYLEAKNMPRAVLVEMENSKQAQEIIAQMQNYPFMISGMPRPVRVRAAKIEMFDERPRDPRRVIQCVWLDPKNPEFEVARKIKHTIKKHAAEASIMLNQQLEEEEKLHNQQMDILKAHYKKFEIIDGAYEDGTVKQLARHYNVPLSDGV